MLVILGLLVGGTLAGRSLIKGAEIRSAISSIDQYRTGWYAFKEKYGCLPGDCLKAEEYFDRGENGNGDWYVNCSDGPTETCEHTYATYHLVEAGYLPGITDYPEGLLPSGLRDCRMNFSGMSPADIYNFDGNVIRIYLIWDGSSWNHGCMTPEEAWTIDTKIDDGFAASGETVGMAPSSRPYTDCNDHLRSAGPIPDSKYNLENGDIACMLFVKL